MTTLIKQIESDRLKYRKIAKESPENALYAKILTTLYGEVSKIGKDAGNRETTNDETTKVIQKFIKGIDEIEKHKTLEVSEIMERDLYKQYLPQELSELLITGFINGTYQDTNVSMKDMKNIMNDLKVQYPNHIINGKLVSNIIKLLISK